MPGFKPLFRAVILAGLLTLAASQVRAQQTRASDSVAVSAVREAFHRALSTGDSAMAMRLLAADVRILEAGGSQSREEYRAEHLAADIAYAQAVPSRTTSTRTTVVGDVAWVTSGSTTSGVFNGRPVNSLGIELMVLRRVADADGPRWVIEAIHWSSRRGP